MDLAASFDRKLVIEQGVGGPGVKPRELEVAVLGNDTPEASVVGEIVPDKEFYDYKSKYESLAENPSVPIIPAKLTASRVETDPRDGHRRLPRLRLRRPGPRRLPDGAWPSKQRAAEAQNPRIYLNEINTMPGFTSISMYPKLWQATGLPYKQLIDRLIALALERHREKQQTPSPASK